MIMLHRNIFRIIYI